MSSRSRSFKFDNVTKQISIAGQVLSDGSSSTPVVSGNLSSNTQSNITAVGTLASLTVSGNISAANYNYANGVSILAGVIANAGAQSGQIVSANTAMVGYVGQQVTTANTAMVGYVGQQVTTANIGLKGYVDGQITTRAALTGATFSGAVTTTELFVTSPGGDEGGQLNLSPAATNTTLVGNIVIDVNQNRLRIFEGGGTNRGGYFDLTGLSEGAGTNLAGGGGGTPGGADSQIQFNNSSSFSGAASLRYFSGNGTVLANATTASTSTTTGVLQVSGGIGVAGNIWCGQVYTTNNNNGTNYRIGDDAWLGDVNVADTTQLMGAQNGNNGYLRFGNVGTETLGRAGGGALTWTGTFAAGNINTDNHNYANGTSVITTISSALTTANVAMKGYVDAAIATVSGNANVQYESLASLTSNAAVQAGLIADTNTAITTANTAMKGYVDGQVSTLTSNAAVQAGDIATIYANLGAVSGSITTLTSNAAAQAGQIASANTAMKGYVDGQISGLINSAPGTLDTLNEIAIALGNDANLSATLTSMILDVQTEVSTANTAMKGYVDLSVSSISTSKISDSNSNVTVVADYVNVAVNSSNVASFSSDGMSTPGNVILANSAGGAGARMTFNPTANSIDFFFG